MLWPLCAEPIVDPCRTQLFLVCYTWRGSFASRGIILIRTVVTIIRTVGMIIRTNIMSNPNRYHDCPYHLVSLA